MASANWPPTTMATQHPDNASAPWWKEDGSAFISTQDEIGELLLLFREFPMDEYMWDWEGKYVDEAVGEKIYSQAQDFFMQRPLGQQLHLTFRIPAFDESKMHRMARAFMNLLSLSDLAQEIGMPSPPVKEMFLPLTTDAQQLITIHETFNKVAQYHSSIFHETSSKHDALLNQFQVTPLVEDVDSMFGIENILKPFWEMLKKKRGDMSATGQRVFLARSDPALNSGLVPAVVANKVAISKAIRLGEDMGFPVYPIIGTGSLPFRGSVNPQYTQEFLDQYAGVRTYSIQSAFRYDYPKEDVRKALDIMKTEVPKRTVQHVSQEDCENLRKLSDIFSIYWKPTVEGLAGVINNIANFVPKRRERLLHIGLFGYSRGVGKVQLPRAIGFTCALYSLGLPPEIIATGRGLRDAREQGLLHILEKYYPALKTDLEHAGKYVNRENIELAAKTNQAFRSALEDLKGVEEYLGKELGPQKSHHMIHRNITSTIFHRLQKDEMDSESITHDIVEAGKIRRSLG